MPSFGGGRIRITYEAATKDLEAGSKRAELSIDGVSDAARRQQVQLDGTSASIDQVDGSNKRYSKSSKDAGRDTDNLTKKLDDVNVRFTAMHNLVGIIKWPALISGAGYAAEGLGELAAGAVATTSALAPLSGALIAYPAILGTFVQSLGVGTLALFGVSSALKEMGAQQVAAGTTAKESAKAQAQAAEQVQSAERSLGQAQVASKRAQTELTAARKEAVDNLQELKDASVDAGFAEERAAISLTKARAELRKARNHPEKYDEGELRDLELSAKEARQGVKEARESKQKAEQEQAKGERQGVDKSPGVRQAHRSVGEAKLQVAEAAHQVTLAQDAERESSESAGTAATKLGNALANMPAAAQKFTKFLFGMKPQLKALQTTAASGLLPGVEGAIKKAMPLFPRLKDAVAETAGAMGHAAERAGDWVGSKGFGKDFSTITKGNTGLINDMTTVGLKLADTLRQLLVAGQPLIKWMGESAAHFATWIDNSAKAGRSSGALTGFFEKTRSVMETLGSIIKNVAEGFWEIGNAAQPLGEEILSALNGQAERFSSWTKSLGGQNTLKQYFAEAKPGIFEFGRLLEDVAGDILKLSQGKGFYELTHELRTQLLPVVYDLVSETTKAFGPALVNALVQFGKLLGTLGGTSGPLTMFVKDVSTLVGYLNWGFKNIPGLATFAKTIGGIFAVQKALKFTGMILGFGKGVNLATKLLTVLGFIEAKQEAIAATSVVSGGVGGVPVVAGAGRDLRTTAVADAGEFGEKQALRDAGLLSAGGAASKAPGILGRLGLLGEDAIPTVAGVATAGIATFGVAVGKELISPAKAGMSESEEKAHLNRADARHDRNVLQGAGFNLESGKTEKQFANLEDSFAKTMAHLKTEAVLGLGGIKTALGTGLGEVDSIWAQGTPKWRQRTAEAMKSAVAEIKQGMHSGAITTEEGQKEINALLKDIHIVRGRNAIGLAEQVVKEFRETGSVTAAGVSDFARELQEMPKAAREKAREASAGMLSEWAAGHPKLEAQIKSLTDFEITKFGATNKQIREGVKTGATGPVAEAFKEAAEGVSGALGNIKVNANDMLKALGWGSLIKFETHGFGPEAKLTGAKSKETHNYQNRARGGYGAPGFLAGSGLRDTVPVMAAPGEAFLTRHQQPEVQLGLAVSKALGIGQNGSLTELFANKRTPHYMAKGGEVIGPRATATIAGATLNRIDTALNAFLGHHPAKGHTATGAGGQMFTGKTPPGVGTFEGVRVDNWIVPILEWARGHGFKGSINSGYRDDAEQMAAATAYAAEKGVPISAIYPGGPLSSNHVKRAYPGGAVDVGGESELQSVLRNYPGKPTLVWGPTGGNDDPVHYSATGHALGGFIQRFAGGGFTSASIKSSGTLSPEEWAIAMLLGGFPAKPGVIAQGLGTIKSESTFNASNQVPGNEHIGGWAEGIEGFPESVGARLNPILSSKAAFANWTAEGGSFWDAWGRYEQEQGGLAGGGAHVYGPEYLSLAGDVVARWLGGGKGSGRGASGGAGGGGTPMNAKPAIGPATSTGLTTALGTATVAGLGGLKPGVITGSASWMPKEFKNQLLQPGLSFGQKLNVANEAVEFAEETGTSAIGGANYGLELEEGNKARLEKKLKELNAELKKPGSKHRRESLEKQREGVLTNLDASKKTIRGFKSSLGGAYGAGEGEGGEETKTFTASDWANAELAEAELTPGTSDDRVVQQKMLGIAELELAEAKANNDPEEIASAAQAVKQLTETLESTNALAEEQLTTSAELALAELTPEKGDDEAAEKKLLVIAEEKLAAAIAANDREAIIQDAHEVKSLREAIEASNEIAQQREGFEKEKLDIEKRQLKIAEEQGPAFMGAFVSWLNGAIGGPLQTNARLGTPGVAADYQ